MQGSLPISPKQIFKIRILEKFVVALTIRGENIFDFEVIEQKIKYNSTYVFTDSFCVKT